MIGDLDDCLALKYCPEYQIYPALPWPDCVSSRQISASSGSCSLTGSLNRFLHERGSLLMWKWVVVTIYILLLGSAGHCTDYDSVLQNAKDRAMAGDFATAFSLCEGAISARVGAPIEPRARLLLGHILNKSGAPVSDCIVQFSKLAVDFPNSPEAPQALLRVGYLRERNKQQPAEWEQIVKEYPRTQEAAEALKGLGHLALRKNDPQAATKYFEASAAVPEADASLATQSRIEACYARISHYWQTSDKAKLREAEAGFRSRIAALDDPKSSDDKEAAIRLRMGLGEVCLIQGLGDSAAKEYQAVLSLDPADHYTRGVARFELGCALYTKRDYADAISAFDAFLHDLEGESLAAKDRAWKQGRPGYSALLVADPAKAALLSGLDLVADAAYWKAASLVELRKFAEARAVLDETESLRSPRTATRVRKLQMICLLALGGEDR